MDAIDRLFAVHKRATPDAAGISSSAFAAELYRMYADRLAKEKEIEATPEFLTMLRKYERIHPAFRTKIAEAEETGRITGNPAVVQQLRNAGKRELGWKPNKAVVWANRHPDIMQAVGAGMFGGSLLGALGGMSTQSVQNAAMSGAGGFVGAAGVAYLLRKLLRSAGRDFPIGRGDSYLPFGNGIAARKHK